MKILILSFSANMVDEESFVSNKIGLTFSCVNNCEKVIKQLHYDCKHICINKKTLKSVWHVDLVDGEFVGMNIDVQ